MTVFCINDCFVGPQSVCVNKKIVEWVVLKIVRKVFEKKECRKKC